MSSILRTSALVVVTVVAMGVAAVVASVQAGEGAGPRDERRVAERTASQAAESGVATRATGQHATTSVSDVPATAAVTTAASASFPNPEGYPDGRRGR